MKKQKITLDTYNWRQIELTDPYEVINEFCQMQDISSYRNLLGEIMQYMYKPKQYKKKDICTVLDIFEILGSLINAVYAIYNNREKVSLAQIEKIQPRELPVTMLSVKEYHNPYRVFKKMFRYQCLKEWHKSIYEIKVYSLSTYGNKPDRDMVSVYIYLSKVFEAVYLIRNRSIPDLCPDIKT